MLYWFKISLGATKIENLVNNIGSLKVRLTDEELKEISDAVTAEGFVGERLTLYLIVLYLSIIRLYRRREKSTIVK